MAAKIFQPFKRPDESFLQYIFRLMQVAGIAVAYSEHAPGEPIIKLLLSPCITLAALLHKLLVTQDRDDSYRFTF
jgi:hypothetical protein